MENDEEKDYLEKRIQMAGEFARLEAKIYGTYVVYMDEYEGLVREFPDGTIVKIR
ncbi:hypothetical protein GLW08_10450 [Pontibacillus yanchengensis]|uniref:Uncharacterized protein n=1 Tax=Pontibacillus yanchengensis TaxID=462910 RepID=A0ACC7VFL4_9BACI|nr:hypothetical protein [Pontibacillus yanchengensis]MYL53756.1 hypothetical protein [Pontibacillus yanchengensis]